jgi:hypothetical protein
VPACHQRHRHARLSPPASKIGRDGAEVAGDEGASAVAVATAPSDTPDYHVEVASSTG